MMTVTKEMVEAGCRAFLDAYGDSQAAPHDYAKEVAAAITAAFATASAAQPAAYQSTFPLGSYARKHSGSWWEGRVVGHYSTDQTPDGVAVQLDRPMGPVQIYPASALEACDLPADQQENERLTRIAHQLPWAEKCVRLEEENERLKEELKGTDTHVDVMRVAFESAYQGADARAAAAEERTKAEVDDIRSQLIRMVDIAEDRLFKIDAAVARIKVLEQRNIDLERLFDKQWTRTRIAHEHWRQAHPGNELVNPDLGELVQWLMGRAGLSETKRTSRFAWGVLLRKGSLWIGANWSPQNKRLCLNLLPCVTIWFTMPGGMRP